MKNIKRCDEVGENVRPSENRKIIARPGWSEKMATALPTGMAGERAETRETARAAKKHEKTWRGKCRNKRS